MTYVPVTVWVPDTAEGGAVVSELQLKACETCHALVPVEMMEAHISQAHPTLEVTPH